MTSYKELYGSQMNESNGDHTNENQGCDINLKELIRTNGITSLSYGGYHSFVSNFIVEQKSQIDFPSRLVKCNTCSWGDGDAIMLFQLRMSLGAVVEWGRGHSGGAGKGSGANRSARKRKVGFW